MRPVHEPSGELPDLELRSACIGCGGDLSIRLRPGTCRSVCRSCGGWGWARVEYGTEGVEVRQASSLAA